jgi:hypothetical protein
MAWRRRDSMDTMDQYTDAETGDRLPSGPKGDAHDRG